MKKEKLENSEMNEPHKFVLNLSERLDLNSLNKHVALQNLSIYYMWKNIKKQYDNNKPKIIVLTWNDEFESPDGSFSMSDIKDYIKYIIKYHEILTSVPPIHACINRINNRPELKIKDGYKLALQMPETVKLVGSTKKLTDKTKNGEKVPSHEVVEVVQCNLEDDQYEQKSEVL